MKKSFVENLRFSTSLILVGILHIGETCLGESRIGAFRIDKTTVGTIRLAPGLGSMVLFPCPLLEVFLGRQNDLKAQISPNDKKTLFLNLKLNSSLPTNLIARCEGEKNYFVFDVLPSKTEHQDVVEIRSSFGRPEVKGLHLTPTETKTHTKVILQSPKLIEKGGPQ